MDSTEFIRKDINGQIISKENNKSYHININTKIDIINVKSYKIYNRIRDEDDYDEEFFEDDDKEEKKENFIESYQKSDCEDFKNKDPHAFSKGGCLIF